MKKIILAVAVAAVAIMGVAGSALAGGGTGITATPAATKTWAGHTATFVRSASGIINETNRVNLDPAGPQNPWTSADVYLQFRPLTGPERHRQPDAEPGLRPERARHGSFPCVNDATDPTIGGTPTNGLLHRDEPVQRVCLSGEPAWWRRERSIRPRSTARRRTCRPAWPGSFRIDVTGTYDERRQQHRRRGVHERSTTGRRQTDGYDVDPCFLGEGFGDVQVNGSFVDWGAYSANARLQPLHDAQWHAVNLAVFDGDSNTNTKDARLVRRQQRLAELHDHLPRSVDLRASPVQGTLAVPLLLVIDTTAPLGLRSGGRLSARSA